jgi:Glycosyl transferase family 2
VRLSVIIPATDRPATLDRCRNAIGGGADEVIVVDEPAGAGPAQARNLGASRATGDVLVFVDSDVLVHADAIERIRLAFAADPALGAVFGCYDDSPAAPGLVSRFRNLLHHHVHRCAAGPADTFWAGLGAVRRAPFVAVGGFDAERFARPSVEDIDLGMRLAAAGTQIELRADVQGTHLKGWTLGQMMRTDLESRAVPWIGLILERRGSTTALNLGWRHRLSALASVAGALAAVRRDVRGVIGAGAALVALNRSFYALLLRRGGARLALGGVVLHALHHLVSVVAVPVGVAVYLRDRLRVRERLRRGVEVDPVDQARQG